MNEDTRVVEYLSALYRVIWFTWFYDQAQATPAAILVEFVDGDDGYDRDTHTLTLRVSEHNRDDVLQAMRLGFNHKCPIAEWPGWYISLIHEMTHEYQHRVLNDTVSAEGQALADDSSKQWDGSGHGASFYTAIVNRAAFLGVPARELCKRL